MLLLLQKEVKTKHWILSFKLRYGVTELANTNLKNTLYVADWKNMTKTYTEWVIIAKNLIELDSGFNSSLLIHLCRRVL